MSQSTANTSTSPAPATPVTATESTHFTYDPDSGLVTQTVTDDGATSHLCYYPVTASQAKADRSDKVPALTTLLAKFKLEGSETLLSSEMALACPTIADPTSPPLMAQCGYMKFPDGSLSDITLTLFGYAQASTDSKGVLIPDTVLNLEGVSVDTTTTPWTVTKATGREGITVSLQQISKSTAGDDTVTATTSTRWYKDNTARQTQKLTETTTVNTSAGTLRAKSESPLKVGALNITSILSQHIRSARSGRVLRETLQDELGRPTTMVYHSYDARDRLLSSIHYDWDSERFAQGRGNGIGQAGTFEQWADQGNGTWVTTIGPDGRAGRTLLDGLQRPVRRELQRVISDDQSANNFVCVEQIAYGADGEPQQRCTYDYLPGGLCVRNDGVALSGQLRDWFWEVQQQATTVDTTGSQSHSTETLTGTVLKGPLRSLEETQCNHADGQVTLTRQHKRWDAKDRAMKDLGLVTKQRINRRGQCDQVTETVGGVDRKWVREYDELGRCTKLTAPDGTHVHRTYQGLSNTPIEISLEDASGEKKVIGRQGLRGAGNQGDDVLSRTVGAVGSSRTYTFQDKGHQRPDGTRMWSESNDDGATVSWYTERASSGVAIPKTLVASFSYNEITQAITAERPQVQENLQSRISSESLAPELLGQLRTERTIRGVRQVRRSLYSLRGSIDTVQQPSGIVSRAWKDAQNRRSRVRRGRLEYRYRYTEQGELDQLVVQDLHSGRSMTVCYGYDSFGRETQRTYRLDGVVKSRYEQSWSVIGQLVSKHWYRNGEATATRAETYTYDTIRNELKRWSVSATTGYEIQDANANTIKDQAYTYDALGNILTCTTHYLDGASEVRTYAYGNALQPSQRTRVTVTHTAKGGQAGTPTVIDLVSDDNGSLTNDSRGQVLSYTPAGQLQCVKKAADEKPAATYEYDEQGRLAAQWDEANQQRRVLAYSGDQLTGESWLDAQGNLVRQRTLDEEAGLVVHCRHIGEDRDTWQTYFMLADPQNGSAEEYSVDSDGAWQSQSVGYTPWGEAPLARLNALNSGQGYNGQRFDPVTGVYHLGHGARVFQPEHQAFWQSDSLSPFAEGGLNDLAYCAGRNPVNWHDPSGHIMISRREEASSLASLDEMIRDTTPPHHEPAAWWEWLVLGVVLVVGVIGAVMTGGLLGLVFLAIAGAAFGLGAAELALRQSNLALSTKLGWASLGVGLFDATGKGFATLGKLLLKGARKGLQGLRALRNAVKLSKLKSFYRGVRGSQRAASMLPKSARRASVPLSGKLSAAQDTLPQRQIATMGGNFDLYRPMYFKVDSPDDLSGVVVLYDRFNVKGAFELNVNLSQISRREAGAAIGALDDILAAPGKSVGHEYTALESAINHLKKVDAKLVKNEQGMVDIVGSLKNTEASFQLAAKNVHSVEKMFDEFDELTKIVRSGANGKLPAQLPGKSSQQILAFLDSHNLKPSCYNSLANATQQAVIDQACDDVLSHIKAVHAPLAASTNNAAAASKKVNKMVSPLFRGAEALNAEFNVALKEVGKKLEAYVDSLPYAKAGSASIEPSIQKANAALANAKLEFGYPLERLRVHCHGTRPDAAKGELSAYAVVRTAPDPAATEGWDATMLYDHIDSLKDSMGNPLLRNNKFDLVELNMCHSAAGGQQSFASEFAKRSGKIVSGYEDVYTTNALYADSSARNFSQLLNNASAQKYSKHELADFAVHMSAEQRLMKAVRGDKHVKKYFFNNSSGPQTHDELKRWFRSSYS